MTMGTKIGTKAFGQTVDKPTNTVNSTSNLSAGDMEKIGGENVGEVLNKIADPNWVDPTKKMRTVGNANLDKDAFFRLMLAQMKNQDPTNPLKPHEMSAQLANFSALEQMTNINQTLNEMKNGQKPTEQFQALSLLGKAVTGDSAKITRLKGDKDHDIRFDLPTTSQEVEVKIRNSAGEVVRTYSLKNLKEGANRVTWNGQDERNLAVAPDEYSVSIEAKNGNGQKMAVKTDFQGLITGVNYTPEGPVLLVGNQTVRLKDVKKIVDPSLLPKDQPEQAVQPEPVLQNQTGLSSAPDLKSKQQITQNEKESNAGAPEKKVQPDLMSGVSLSREMMTKLQKETAPGT